MINSEVKKIDFTLSIKEFFMRVLLKILLFKNRKTKTIVRFNTVSLSISEKSIIGSNVGWASVSVLDRRAADEISMRGKSIVGSYETADGGHLLGESLSQAGPANQSLLENNSSGLSPRDARSAGFSLPPI